MKFVRIVDGKDAIVQLQYSYSIATIWVRDGYHIAIIQLRHKYTVSCCSCIVTVL